MQRLYSSLIKKHFEKYEQMAFLCGPRQVGKTTVAQSFQNSVPYFSYLNWDNVHDRERILKGYDALCAELPMGAAIHTKPILVLDELHKYKEWKNFIKGFFDQYKGQLHILLTGSARLDVYRKGGDSLAGRYFLYREHPLSVGELLRTESEQNLIAAPQALDAELYDALFQWGGFPEPFMQRNQAFQTQWQRLRRSQIFTDDILSVETIHDMGQFEVLMLILQQQAAQQVNYHTLSKHVRVSDHTIRRWMSVLEAFYHHFTLRPWRHNVARSLLKEPKMYLWDWSLVKNSGQRAENFIACHLLKAVHAWTDQGLGEFELWFVRDKEQHEVDFLITRDQIPWVLLEVKQSYKTPLSDALHRFQTQLKAEHVFQVALDMPYEPIDCFTLKRPSLVSARTLLSQLV